MSDSLQEFLNEDPESDNQAQEEIEHNVDGDNEEGEQDSSQESEPLPANVEKALSMGWKPKEEWEGDPDEWSSANRFLQTRELVESNKELRAKQDKMDYEFNQRIDRVNKFHEQMLKRKIEELKEKRDLAVEDADVDAYKAANKELDELEGNNQEQPQSHQQDPSKLMEGVINHPVTQSFINENQWIKGNDPKAVYGQKVFTDWIAANANNPNAILEDGLAQVKSSVEQQFKTGRQQPMSQMAERGNGPKKLVKKNGLSMNDLTREEMAIWKHMGKSYKDQAEFLQVVADSRKEA